ncbi:MAG: type II secretion system F family protein [Hyphomicrobium sp.]
MTVFRYRALTNKGEIVTGEITAPHRGEVLKRIEYLGLIPIQTEPLSGSGGNLQSFLKKDFKWSQLFADKPKNEDVTTFSRDLAILLRSEIRLDTALDLLSEPEMSGVLAPRVSQLHAAVMSGENFADALSKDKDLFPPMYSALVRIGETSGNLAGVMEAVSEQRTRLSEMRNKTIDSLRYPALLLGAATVVLLFFLLYVLPQFASVFQDLGAKVDPIVSMLLWLSESLRNHFTVIGFVLGLLVLLIIYMIRSPRIRQRFQRFLMKLPLLRNLYTDYRTVLFCRTLGVLLANGAQLPTALHLVAEVISDEATEDLWMQTREKVRHGKRLSEALSDNKELAAIALRMLKIGEEAGRLPTISLRAADLVEARLDRRLQRLSGIIGPAAILFIALLVGGLVVSLMTSLLSIGQLTN